MALIDLGTNDYQQCQRSENKRVLMLGGSRILHRTRYSTMTDGRLPTAVGSFVVVFSFARPHLMSTGCSCPAIFNIIYRPSIFLTIDSISVIRQNTVATLFVCLRLSRVGFTC
jgi:hypothetical protein